MTFPLFEKCFKIVDYIFKIVSWSAIIGVLVFSGDHYGKPLLALIGRLLMLIWAVVATAFVGDIIANIVTKFTEDKRIGVVAIIVIWCAVLPLSVYGQAAFIEQMISLADRR